MLGSTEGEALGDGVGEGVSSATFGAGGMRPDRINPSTMAATIAPRAPPIEVREAWSVGKRPPGPVETGATGWMAYPHERQTWAQDGFSWPQLKHSTVSPVIGPEPSTHVAAGGENADGLWKTPQRVVRGGC
jgi:hypothetical protein